MVRWCGCSHTTEPITLSLKRAYRSKRSLSDYLITTDPGITQSVWCMKRTPIFVRPPSNLMGTGTLTVGVNGPGRDANCSLPSRAKANDWRCRLRLRCDGTRAETRFCLPAKRTRPFKSAGASVQSTTGSWGVRISGSNAGYTMFRGSVKITGYPLHSPVSPSLPLPCVIVCRHISSTL